jgi:nitrous oxidase accessory protein NosD
LQKIGDTDRSINGNTLENNSIGVIVTAEGGRPSENNAIGNNVKVTWSTKASYAALL